MKPISVLVCRDENWKYTAEFLFIYGDQVSTTSVELNQHPEFVELLDLEEDNEFLLVTVYYRDFRTFTSL